MPTNTTTLDRAVAHLGATQLSDGDYAYRDDGMGRWYVTTEADLVSLTEDYLDSEDEDIRRDAYSHWCTTTDATDPTLAQLREIGVTVTVDEVTEEYASDAGPEEYAAYVCVRVTVDGDREQVGTMVGARESDWGSIRASGAGLRPFLGTWWADSSDWSGLAAWAVEPVKEALYEARHRLWAEVEAMREAARPRPAVTVTLYAGGMGDVSEADFDAWASYVTDRLDAATGLDVTVEQARFGEAREDRVDDRDHEDTVREALRDLWEAFCADDAAWPARVAS